MSREILNFLSDKVNLKNLNENVYSQLYQCGEFDLINNSDENLNISLIHYLRYEYIDRLISLGKASSELRDLYDKYILFNDLLKDECGKIGSNISYSSEYISEMCRNIKFIEFYLKMYGVLSLNIDYKKIINDHANECDVNASNDILKKVLSKIDNFK